MTTQSTEGKPDAFRVEPGSFRDRQGRVYRSGGEIFRGLSSEALQSWRVLSSKKFFTTGVARGDIVATSEANIANVSDDAQPDAWAGFLQHEPIPFISYPYEWSFEMLRDAALLHLRLLLSALSEGFILKDSSSYNIQFVGSRPVFIDIPSFEQLTPGEPWVGYRQFCQLFLYPLLLQAYKDIPFHYWLRGRLDGIDPQECAAMMSLRDLFRPGVFGHVYLQSKLVESLGTSTRKVKDEVRNAGFSQELIRINASKLTRLIERLEWRRTRSEWSDYATHNSYDSEQAGRKHRFVQNVVMSRRRSLCWDLGCNTGDYSRLLEANSQYVVAMDIDHLAVNRFYTKSRSNRDERALSLVSNLVDPSPALGWRGLERQTVLTRGKPDLVLALALIHHVVIGANVPLAEFIGWLASLRAEIVLEMVTKEDAMVKKLLLNKRDIYQDYTVEYLEQCLGRHFVVNQREAIMSGTRILYHATPLSA